MEDVLIDVQDVDYEWFREVRAFLDRSFDRYYLPRESVERLGEPADDSADYFLLDGRIMALADEIEIEGRQVQVWAVATNQLLTRPAAMRSG